MNREVDGIEAPAKEGLLRQLYAESTARNPGHDRPVICPLDGERALRDVQRAYSAEAVGILDLFQAPERPRAVAHRFRTGATQCPSGLWSTGSGTCFKGGPRM